jgi:hypothetical protein
MLEHAIVPTNLTGILRQVNLNLVIVRILRRALPEQGLRLK